MFHIFHRNPDFFSYLPTKVRKINEFSKIFQGIFLAHPYRQMICPQYEGCSGRALGLLIRI